MASTPVQFESAEGLTLTVELYPDGSDTIANGSGDTATEAANRDGTYTITVTEALTGLHQLKVFSSGTFVATLWANIADDATTYHATLQRHDAGVVSSLATIVADTNELQTNQGNWVTATGFSTLDTGDIDARLAAYDAPTKAELDAAIAGLNDISAAEVNAECDTAISDASLATAAALAAAQTDLDTITDTGVEATNMRGTDGANTTTPPTTAAIADNVWDELLAAHSVSGSLADAVSTTLQGVAVTSGNVDAVLADTNELQTNQSGWLTATGFSTHSAADVWASGTRTLTSFGTLIADIWAAATRTLTAGTKDTEIDAIKAVADKADDTYEDNAGTYRFTSDALAEGPSGGGGGGGDATAANQTTMLANQATLLAGVNVTHVNGSAVSLSGITFTINNAVSSDSTITVRRGTDYSPTIGTQLEIIKSGYASSAFSSGASGEFRYRQANGSVVSAGTVAVTQSGNAVTASITLTDTEIDAMTANKAGTWECDITSSGGLIADHGKGKLIVSDKVA